MFSMDFEFEGSPKRECQLTMEKADEPSSEEVDHKRAIRRSERRSGSKKRERRHRWYRCLISMGCCCLVPSSKYGTHDGAVCWINKYDFGGLLFVGVIWAMILYIEAFVLYLGIRDSIAAVHVFVLSFLLGMTMVAHVKTMFTDPGSIPQQAVMAKAPRNNDDVDRRFCSRCQTARTRRTHHCRICDRCIVGMDHHCPWINNCVGINNQKKFILFLSYSMITGIYMTALTIYVMIVCEIGSSNADISCNEHINDVGSLIMVALACFVCIFALVFCIVMLSNQIRAFRTGKGTIERLQLRNLRQNEHVEAAILEEDCPSPSLLALEAKNTPMRLQDIFGSDFFLFYFFPIDPHFDTIDRILHQGEEYFSKQS